MHVADDPVPAELREFRVESWEVLVDGEPSDDFMPSQRRHVPDRDVAPDRGSAAVGDARGAWAREHGWPGGTVAHAA
ncbi:MAG: hypothetical protein WKF47_07490 [Geodermatophilaceae bacterium]